MEEMQQQQQQQQQQQRLRDVTVAGMVGFHIGNVNVRNGSAVGFPSSVQPSCVTHRSNQRVGALLQPPLKPH